MNGAITGVEKPEAQCIHSLTQVQSIKHLKFMMDACLKIRTGMPLQFKFSRRLWWGEMNVISLVRIRLCGFWQ